MKVGVDTGAVIVHTVSDDELSRVEIIVIVIVVVAVAVWIVLVMMPSVWRYCHRHLERTGL